MKLDLPRFTERFGSISLHGVQRVFELDSGLDKGKKISENISGVGNEVISEIESKMAIVIPIKNERLKLYSYLAKSFDNFSEKKKELSPQPVRIRYIKFPDERFVKVGIDIYGKHFLWTIDKQKNWDVIKVEDLWVY